MRKNKEDLSIILPTYNEKENIERLIPELEDGIKHNRWNAEIIVVDDSSPDKTYEVSEELNKKYGNIRTIIRKKKEGIGPALREGYNKANGRIIASIDVDSFGNRELEILLSKLNNGFDMVVGSRHHKSGGYEYKNLKSYVKRAMSRVGNALTRLMTGLPITDFSLNCRVMTKNCWNAVSSLTRENGSAFLLEMIWYAHRKGYKVGEVPVNFRDRQFGKSKMNLLKQPLRFLLALMRLRISK